MNPDNPYNPYQPQQPQQPAQPQPQMQQGGQPYAQQPYQMPGQQPQVGMPQAGYGQIQPQTPPTKHRSSNPAKMWLILSFVFIFTTFIGGGVSIWAYINYMDQKNNVDSKIDVAVAEAVKVQADEDAAAFLEKEKQPNRQFVGPDDYGRLSFDYPKTWSVYVENDASDGDDYEAYFNPGEVPTVANDQQFALRVTIENTPYDEVVEDYADLIKKNQLTSSSFKAGEQSGTRLDGAFSKDIRGMAVIFKIRDKTVTLRSDADTFKKDFDALIQTIDFNQ